MLTSPGPYKMSTHYKDISSLPPLLTTLPPYLETTPAIHDELTTKGEKELPASTSGLPFLEITTEEEKITTGLPELSTEIHTTLPHAQSTALLSTLPPYQSTNVPSTLPPFLSTQETATELSTNFPSSTFGPSESPSEFSREQASTLPPGSTTEQLTSFPPFGSTSSGLSTELPETSGTELSTEAPTTLVPTTEIGTTEEVSSTSLEVTTEISSHVPSVVTEASTVMATDFTTVKMTTESTDLTTAAGKYIKNLFVW